MNNRTTKIIVDIFMTIFLILSFIRWDNSNFAFHAVVGVACTLFFGVHVFIHRKWLKATTKSCFKGKLNKPLRAKYVIDVLLLAAWTTSIVTGFIAVFPFLDWSAATAFAWGRFHGITARIALVLVIIHIIQHLPQIKSYIGIKKQAGKGVA